MESDSASENGNFASDHDEVYASDPDGNSSSETISQSGSTIKPIAKDRRALITYNKRGVPIGETAKKLTSFEGKTARTMIPITYERWLDVPKETKEDAWNHVLKRFVLDPKSRKRTLQSIATKWRNFKHKLYKNFIEPKRNDPKALLDPPTTCRFLTKDDWKQFVAQRLSKKWQDQSKKAKEIRSQYKYNHHLSRKGYAGLTVEIMQETGKTEEEIDRATLWKEARKMKTGGFDENVQVIVNKIDELHKSGYESCGTHDVLTEALGTEEQRGHVRGMGKFVTQDQYFFVSKNVKRYLDAEKKKTDERFNKLEDELEKLKRGMRSVSEVASCQMGSHKEEFEGEPLDQQLLDNSCYLAVDIASNIVAKGSIVDYCVSGENIEVLMQVCLQGEALLPIPIEEKLIDKVKDAVGFILSWPRNLVIRCSDLEKLVPKLPMRKNAKRLREFDDEDGKEKEQPRKQENGKEKDQPRKQENEKEKKKKMRMRNDDERMENNKEKGKEKENEKMIVQKKMTKARRNTRIRIEKSGVLKMIAMMADAKFSKVDYIKLQCEDDLFGYESSTCLTSDDFERVFTLQEITGGVIISYMMHLFEQINDESKKNHGICFVSPAESSPRERKSKFKNIADSSRRIINRLFNRKDNDIILIPYNPGNHWVLAVLHIKTMTCYYLDSLRPRSVNSQLKQIIDGATDLYATHSGSGVKLNWVNAWCPSQPGGTECGYYMLKFMKEIVNEGIDILLNDNVGGGNYEYTDADIDGIREEWSTFVASFIYQ